MKKFTLIITSVICTASLVACGKESDFKKAINADISQSPKCLNIYNSTYGVDSNLTEVDSAKIKDKIKDSYVVVQNFDKNGKNSPYREENEQKQLAQFNSLTNAGLLAKSTEKLSTINWDNKPDGGYKIFTIYTLTDAGKNTAFKGKTNGIASAFGYDGRNIFCYATPEVNKIENYTEGDMGGRQFAEVKYSYDYINVASWANKEDVRAAFPEIAKNLDNPDKTSKTALMKTNNGWSTDL